MYVELYVDGESQKEEAFGMNRRMLVLLILLLTLLTTAAFGEWELLKVNDPMTGQVSWYAVSPVAYPSRTLSYPYTNLQAWIAVSVEDGTDLPFVLFSVIPVFYNSSAGNGYYLIDTRVKWNNSVEQMLFYQAALNSRLYFVDFSRATKLIRNSNIVMIEFNLYPDGIVYFTFDLTGASKAIDNLHAVYGKK
mgnify:CR=1 FL=1